VCRPGDTLGPGQSVGGRSAFTQTHLCYVASPMVRARFNSAGRSPRTHSAARMAVEAIVINHCRLTKKNPNSPCRVIRRRSKTRRRASDPCALVRIIDRPNGESRDQGNIPPNIKLRVPQMIKPSILESNTGCRAHLVFVNKRYSPRTQNLARGCDMTIGAAFRR